MEYLKLLIHIDVYHYTYGYIDTYVAVAMFLVVPSGYEWYTTPFNVHENGLYSYCKLVIFVLMYVQLYMQCLILLCIVMHC